MKAMLPPNEEARLRSLKQYEILDTADEMAYDDLVVLAASICQAPMAFVSLVDEYRQWFKARIGVGFRDTDRDLSFCAHTILKPEQIMIVPDARHDLRFSDNDLVLGKPNIRFYAGVALVNPEGMPLGCLAVMDREPRSITVDQTEMLRALARQVMAQMELRKAQLLLRGQADQLLKAREDAAVAEKAKNVFLANISHEFRTPINGIVGLSSLLVETKLTDRQIHYVETIEKSAGGLLNVLSNILEYSKNERGDSAINISRVDTIGLVNEVASMMRPMAIAKQIRFDVKVDEKLRQKLMGDELKIQQVLANLVGNALKFTPSGFIEIHVSQVSENQQAAVVRFEVKDSGIGIPANLQAMIFDEFSQADQGSERHYEGTGLGLAICRQLSHLMGSRINVKSELGAGSTFWFDLVMPFESAYLASNGRGSGLSNGPKSKSRVLIVEDNEINAMVLTSMLQKTRCQVSRVELPADAVSLMQTERFDLIFMDVQMPDMEGIQATRAIRCLPFPGCNVPVVAMAASVFKEDESECRAAGMNDFISKPVSDRVVSQALERWLSHAESKALM